jgi:hypothetical protein
VEGAQIAIGSKLSKILGGIGAGLSFVPGPWSAIGVALTAATTIAGAVGAKKEAQAQEPELAPSTQATPAPDASRPRSGQLPTTQQQPQPGPVSAKVFNQPQGLLQGDYRSQMQSAIANLILKGDLNDLGGV